MHIYLEEVEDSTDGCSKCHRQADKISQKWFLLAMEVAGPALGCTPCHSNTAAHLEAAGAGLVSYQNSYLESMLANLLRVAVLHLLFAELKRRPRRLVSLRLESFPNNRRLLQIACCMLRLCDELQQGLPVSFCVRTTSLLQPTSALDTLGHR